MNTISEVAARWVVRSDAGPLAPDEEGKLNAWLAEDPRHRGAYIRERARWVDLDRIAALNGPANSATESPGLSHARAVSTFAVSRRQLLAATIAVAAVVGGGMSWVALRGGRGRYRTAIGEVRRIPLSDGSTLLLNTDTDVKVQFGPQQRDIQLTRGEALFEVAHDEARPFVVHANETTVRAVGTAFAVRLEAAQIDVTVTEGVVEVLGPAAALKTTVSSVAAESAAQRVKANQRVVLTQARPTQIEPIAEPQINRQLAWREGMVSFDGEALATAAAEINRHNQRQIVIDDPVLGRKPVIGRFRTTDIDGFCAAAAAALKARVVLDGTRIRLEPLISPSRN
ncbi:MAG: FecR domain-containing protein [Gammaproteobacteria bacterium]